MKNFFDTWSIIFDSHNKPLVGKLEFYEANTTSLKTVYDIDGSELLNPIYVNGRPDAQVMLGDGDYDIKFYEYIGHGDMRHDSEYGNWFCYKTEYVIDDSITAAKTNDVPSVNTINDLKALANMQDGDVVQVIGYHTTYDCPARYYIWHEASGRNDDGGIIIKSNQTTQGYWEMKIPGSYIDVRWYGDIPSSFSSAVSSNLGQRTKAAAAANYYHKDLYFPSYGRGNALGFYMFDGSNTVSVSKDIICDNGVRFVVKAGTTGTMIQCHEFYKCDKYLFISVNNTTAIGGYNLECNWTRTSWLGKDRATDISARVGYIIDYLNTPLILSNTKVKFERDGLNRSGCTFDDCLFEDCHKNIDRGCTFYNMEIKQSWFADDFDFVSDCNFYDCTIKLENFNDADTYIRMKNKQNEHNYGDLNEAILNNATILTGTASDPAIIENCGGSITLANGGSGYVELHNAGVSISGVNSNTNLNMVDCWMSLTGNNLVCNSIALRRGSISGTKVQVLNNVYMENADINCELYIPGATNQFNSCNVHAKITSVNLKLDSCNIYSVVESWPSNKSFKFELISNRFFGEGAYHHLTTNLDATAEHDTTVDGVWTGNTANYNTQHWVHVRQYGVKYYDHTYVYVNNGNPYFDRMNGQAITFYGVTMYVEVGETAKKDRIRTDIPLIVINTANHEVRLANFKTYGFSIASGLSAHRIKMFCDNATDSVSGRYVDNAIILNCRYALPSTMQTNQEYFNWEFKSYDISSGTDEGEKFKEGSNMGWTNNDNLNVYTHSLSVWHQDSTTDNKPMARKSIRFEIVQDINTNIEFDPGVVEE